MEPQELELRLGNCRHSSSETTVKCSSEFHRRRQQITILYDGKVCVSYIADHQARAIIDIAKEAAGPHTPSPRLQMKRSLQRFLQKRRERMAAYRSCPPYAQQPLQLFSSSS